mmetsp:Transcript_93863/g.270426  ORF Transcript_93863/g.270426 Transcript_93863/m.270426 type:complete len:180 (-) Transcript_93863:103-642(-)
MHLIYRYFGEHRPEIMAATCPEGRLSDARIFLAECQLLVTDPGAVPQIWHADNLKPGLTVLVPFTDVDAEVGPTELLPGTHHFADSGGVAAAAAALLRSGGARTPPPLSPGDVLVYDSRLWHRGMGNGSIGRCRVVLATRFDVSDTPPPGATLLQTQEVRVVGRILGLLSSVYSALPVP